MNSAEPGGLFHTLVSSTAHVAAATVHAKSHASFFHSAFETERRFNEPVKSGEFLGTVKKDSGGRLGADDYLIDSLLQFAQTPTPGSTRTLRGIEMHGDEARLVFSMDPKIEKCHADFSEFCRVSDVLVTKHATTRNTVMLDEESIPILIPVMLKVMLEGRDAFKPNAKVGLPGHENQHPYDYLAEMKPQIMSDNHGLKAGLDRVLADRPDYRARLAAAQLLKMATEKQAAPGGWAMSTALAAAFQTPWVLAAIPAFAHFLEQKNLSPTRAAAALAGLNMIPSTFIEMIDATIGFAILSTFKKEEWTLREIAPKAALAGLISGVTSFPYNLLRESGGIPDGPYPVVRDIANLGLNFAAAVTQVTGAGIGVPMEAQAGKARLTAALAHSIGDQDGLLSMPSDLRSDAQVKAYVDELAARATHHNPSDGVAQASVPVMIGAAMIAVVLDAKSIVTHGKEHFFPDEFLKIVDIVAFQPIEAHALHVIWLASKAGMSSLLKSDEDKQKKLMAALTEAERLGRPFTRDDLRAIDAHLLKRIGGAISDAVMATIQRVPHNVDGLRGRDTRLQSRVIYPAARTGVQGRTSEAPIDDPGETV